MTAKETATLAFCTSVNLKGHQLYKALAQHRGIKLPTAEIAVLRLIGKGFLQANGVPTKALQLIADAGQLLTTIRCEFNDRAAVESLRDRIAEFVSNR